MVNRPDDDPPAYTEDRPSADLTPAGATILLTTVYCNGCRQPIQLGVHYKCLECDNFDLCAECCDAPPPSHPDWHSFLRMGTPAFQQMHIGVTCDGCGMSPLRGKRYLCKVYLHTFPFNGYYPSSP
ncbi:hypothetical protein CYLTODRAFT_419680 [Cylindrobasidium torrendii FP15055 ss-10]|uniref:ZZ-type domain-containing protein n=1 Tax=Cylindrobasidium torrendii FP15055 ss-10 TaxID=1314674 RepID=A0A0D7BJ54_9AGAR|nr:hypothetical protein CYLTODRAFT_419680 [Cylindrobasidium torrendii FP15055 ss-10]